MNVKTLMIKKWFLEKTNIYCRIINITCIQIIYLKFFEGLNVLTQNTSTWYIQSRNIDKTEKRLKSGNAQANLLQTSLRK